MLARILPDAFPGIRFLAIAADQIGGLVEMAADDSAARQHRLPLARALLVLATSPVPAPPSALPGQPRGSASAACWTGRAPPAPSAGWRPSP